MSAREQAVRLEALGLSLPLIADRVGVSKSTIYRWLRPGYAERSRKLSNEAKRRRTGVCEDCGAETRYNGHSAEVSARCLRCSAIRVGDRKSVWTQEAVIEAIREWALLYGDPPAIADWNPHQCEHVLHDYERPERYKAGYWPSASWVVRRFGRWNAALVAAGFDERAPHGGGGNRKRARDVR